MESQKFSTKSGILLMIKIIDNMAEEMKMILLLNLKLKSLSLIYVVTLMHIF